MEPWPVPRGGLTGRTWRNWPVLCGGLGRSHWSSHAEAFGPMWRPWPVPCGGLGRSHVEAFTGPTGGLGRSHVEAFTGPTWKWQERGGLGRSRPWPFPRGGHNGPTSWPVGGLGPTGGSHVEDLAGPKRRLESPMWRPCQCPRGDLHKNVEALRACVGLPVPRGGLGRSHVEALANPMLRPWPVPRGGLHRSNVEAVPWRPSPVPRGGHCPTWRLSHVEALAGPTWRPCRSHVGWPVPQPQRGLSYIGPCCPPYVERGLS